MPLADALGEAAMDLAGDDHRVHLVAEIVDRGQREDVDLAGLGIDLDLAEMDAIGEGEIRRIEIGGLLEAGLDLGRREGDRIVGSAGDGS